MKLGRYLGMALFIGFIVIQAFATSSKTNVYPFSPYRMFSKHWADGIVMAQVKIVDDTGKALPAWQAMEIPFFQANQLMYSIFLDPAPEEARTKLCNLMRSKLHRDFKVVEDHVKYSRISDGLAASIEESADRYHCSQI